MKTSLFILCCFISGALLAWFQWIPAQWIETDYSFYILAVMMFFVGMSIGADLKSLWRPIRLYKAKIMLIPLATIAGSLLACLVMSWFLHPVTTRETVAIGAGFGYYSLSSIYLKELAGSEVGLMALISNMTREMGALLLAPILARYAGKLAPIAAAGATSLDTALPVITRYSGHQFVVIAVFHGVIVDLSVPVIISLLYL